MRVPHTSLLVWEGSLAGFRPVLKSFEYRQGLGFEQSQGAEDNAALQAPIVRPAQRIAQWKRDEQRAGRLDFACNGFEQSKRYAGNTGLFQNSLDQTDGLITHGSDRDE